MIEFDENVTCPKCGTNMPNMEYCHNGNYLECKCYRCGYLYFMKTKDHKEEKDVQIR